MAVVSRTSIQKLIQENDIVIFPYTESKIGNCSVDVRLGKWYFIQSQNDDPVIPYKYSENLHPWDQEPKYSEIIKIKPNEIVLVTTEEFIGSRLECTTMAKTKSSLARLGIDICGSSGWGDIGYINRWAFPLHNRSNKEIHLHAGTWFAQIIFLTVSDKEISYTQGGNYQSTDDIKELVTTWDPKSILPKPLSYDI